MLRQIKNMLRWARITKAGADDKQFPIQQMEYLGKVGDGVMVFPFGFHGNVTPDSLALMFAVQGHSDNRAAIAFDPKNRPKLAEGEVAFYHPPTGAFMIWRSDGSLEIETANEGTANINIKANLNITGNLSVTGETALGETVTSDGTNISNDHVHGGVQSGGSNTGGPQ